MTNKFDRCFRVTERNSALENKTTQPCNGTRWGHDMYPDRYREVHKCDAFVEAQKGD